ncbi:Gldg family protein [bacterium]|jgi:ABC-2 type transport system permease protein|nr:Gldg family protein [bacterium]
MLLGSITGYGPADFLIVYVLVGLVGLGIWYLVGLVSPPLTFAVFKRNIVSYFTNPIGYLFITAFTAIGAYFAFWHEDRFFAANLCDLSQLNSFFPYVLLFFVPAITMSIWAEERRSGTEELLLTLPGTDLQVVLGKFLAALAIYTVGLVFLSLQYFVLASLGSPDGGLVLSTFVGYWLIGMALISAGMIASQLTSNVTIAFILGTAFCLLLLGIYSVGTTFTTARPVRYILENAGMVKQFEPFGRGIIPLDGMIYFLGLTATFLYVNVVLLSRRHWEGGAQTTARWSNYVTRIVSLAVIVVAGTMLARLGSRYFFVDATEERLHSLSADTLKIIDGIDPKRPVLIEAYLSPNPPREFERIRRDLVDILQRFDALGGDKVTVDIFDTEVFSNEARDAESVYSIKPQEVPIREDSRQTIEKLYMGVAIKSGSSEKVIPFFYPALPVEYEIARTIRSVAQASRPKVGIMTTDANLFGEFNFQMMTPAQDWQIVNELKQQYEVVRVAPDVDVPADVKVLLVPMASSLSDPQIDRLVSYVAAGRPALILDDPMPLVNVRLAARREKEPPRQNMMMGMPPQPPEPKGNLGKLTRLLNMNFDTGNVVWQAWNPVPELPDLPPEYVFIGPGSGNSEAFNPASSATSGLQQLVTLFPGSLQPLGGDGPTFKPLLTTGRVSGTTPWDKIIKEEMFGMRLNDRPPRLRSPREYVLAAQIKGKLASGAPATTTSKPAASGGGDDAPAAPAAKPSEGSAPPAPTEPKEINVIFVADLDIVSDQMFALRQQAQQETLKFDNVPFILNCVDLLAGDEGFLALRKKRPKRRTLDTLELLANQSVREEQAGIEEAQAAAEKAIGEAQKKLNDEVDKIDKDTSIAKNLRDQKKAFAQSYWQNYFDREKDRIERETEQKVRDVREETTRSRRAEENRVKWLAVLLPPIPALLIGLAVFFVRQTGEREGVDPKRLV